MSQPPTYGPPGGYGPPPPAAPPASRRRIPWWGWMLGGCGGCSLVALVGIVIAVVAGANLWKQATKDLPAVTVQSVQQGMGEVALYPGSNLNVGMTQLTWSLLRVAERTGGKEPGSVLRSVAVLTTQDEPEKVLQFYDQRLRKAGWKEIRAKDGSRRQMRVFQKGRDTAMVQVQVQPGTGTLITLMRGGPGLMQMQPPAAGDPGQNR